MWYQVLAFLTSKWIYSIWFARFQSKDIQRYLHHFSSVYQLRQVFAIFSFMGSFKFMKIKYYFPLFHTSSLITIKDWRAKENIEFLFLVTDLYCKCSGRSILASDNWGKGKEEEKRRDVKDTKWQDPGERKWKLNLNVWPMYLLKRHSSMVLS